MTVATRRFNPGFLTEDELVASFCVRIHEFESILETLRGCTGNSNQHQIVIGPRGSGKTTLLLRVAADISRDPELSRIFFPVRFAEESYEVSSAGEFWLECLGNLAEQVPLDEDGPDLNRAFEELRKIADDQLLADRCLGAILNHSDHQARRLVLLVENLNMMFKDMTDPDAGWRLRHTLQTEPRIVLLASATSRFKEIDDPDNALYDLLKVHSLEPLKTEECGLLWKTLTGESGSADGMRALEILTGGSPRLLAILGRFSSGRSLAHLIDQLVALVDDHTEYFKSHIELLPPQERRVFLALADLWKPATTKEISERSRIDTNRCSGQLRRLTDRGMVRVAGGTAKRKQYYLSERLYNLYYLLRRHRGPERVVRALLEFMASYYSPLDLAKMAAHFLSEVLRPTIQDTEVNGLREAALKQLGTLPELLSPEDATPAHLEAEPLRSVALAAKVGQLLREDDPDRALRVLDKRIAEIAPTTGPGHALAFTSTQTMKGVLLRHVGRASESIDILDEALGTIESWEEPLFDAAVAQVLRNRAAALADTGRFDEALATYTDIERRFRHTDVPTIRTDVATALLEKVSLLVTQERLEEALEECEVLTRRYGSSTDPRLHDLCTRAVRWRALLLAKSLRLEDSLASFVRLEERLQGRELTDLDDQFLDIVVLKALVLVALDQLQAARETLCFFLENAPVERSAAAMALGARASITLAYLELSSGDHRAAARAASHVLSRSRNHTPRNLCRALLIRAQATLSYNTASSKSDLKEALGLLSVLEGLPPEAPSALVAITLELGPARTLALINESASGPLLLPLKTALEQELGHETRVAKEVEEVARDIRRDLRERKRDRRNHRKDELP